jgi:hypothetical protein
MTAHDPLADLDKRQRELEAHLLRSQEYLYRADQTLKRQTAMLYLAIALLFSFQIAFTVSNAVGLPLHLWALITLTSALAVFNCVLLIRTKRSLSCLNQAWLRPHEKSALDSLEEERLRLLQAAGGERK